MATRRTSLHNADGSPEARTRREETDTRGEPAARSRTARRPAPGSVGGRVGNGRDRRARRRGSSGRAARRRRRRDARPPEPAPHAHHPHRDRARPAPRGRARPGGRRGHPRGGTPARRARHLAARCPRRGRPHRGHRRHRAGRRRAAPDRGRVRVGLAHAPARRRRRALRLDRGVRPCRRPGLHRSGRADPRRARRTGLDHAAPAVAAHRGEHRAPHPGRPGRVLVRRHLLGRLRPAGAVLEPGDGRDHRSAGRGRRRRAPVQLVPSHLRRRLARHRLRRPRPAWRTRPGAGPGRCRRRAALADVLVRTARRRRLRGHRP